MKCPKCGLENPPSAQVCDCGYNFESNTQGSPIFAKISASEIHTLVSRKEYILASLGQRIAGQVLDFVVASLILFAIAAPFSFIGGKSDSVFGIAIFLYFSYLLFADGLARGQSLGKRAMKTAVI